MQALQPVGDPGWGSPEWLYPVERTHAEDVCKGLFSWVGPQVGAEKEFQEERAAETKYPLVPLWDRRVRSEAETFKQGQWGQDTFTFVFLSLYSTMGSRVTFLKSSLFGL